MKLLQENTQLIFISVFMECKCLYFQIKTVELMFLLFKVALNVVPQELLLKSKSLLQNKWEHQMFVLIQD
jgi:hypothetical protein